MIKMVRMIAIPLKGVHQAPKSHLKGTMSKMRRKRISWRLIKPIRKSILRGKRAKKMLNR